jgi:hypothetical protein
MWAENSFFHNQDILLVGQTFFCSMYVSSLWDLESSTDVIHRKWRFIIMMSSRNELIWNLIRLTFFPTYVVILSVLSITRAWTKCVKTELGLLWFCLLLCRNKCFWTSFTVGRTPVQGWRSYLDQRVRK